MKKESEIVLLYIIDCRNQKWINDNYKIKDKNYKIKRLEE